MNLLSSMNYCFAFVLPQSGPTTRWFLAPPPLPPPSPPTTRSRRRTFLHKPELTFIRSYRSEKEESSATATTSSSSSSSSNSLDPHITEIPLHHHHHHPNPTPTPAYLREELIEKIIYRCRFLTVFAVLGSLMGSIICFLKGCVSIFNAYAQHSAGSGKTILMLVEAIALVVVFCKFRNYPTVHAITNKPAADVYLLGTVMLVFGMGLYELFISNFDIAKTSSQGSNLLGLFKLSARPQWMEIQSVDELKTKIGHVIVMVLLVGMFEKSKRVTISSTKDLLCFAASIFLSSSCLYLLSKLHTSKQSNQD